MPREAASVSKGTGTSRREAQREQVLLDGRVSIWGLGSEEPSRW